MEWQFHYLTYLYVLLTTTYSVLPVKIKCSGSISTCQVILCCLIFKIISLQAGFSHLVEFEVFIGVSKISMKTAGMSGWSGFFIWSLILPASFPGLCGGNSFSPLWSTGTPKSTCSEVLCCGLKLDLVF